MAHTFDPSMWEAEASGSFWGQCQPIYIEFQTNKDLRPGPQNTLGPCENRTQYNSQVS